MTLPRFVVLKSKSNNKYLRYTKEDVQLHGFLNFSGEEIVSPYVKFEVEKAKIGNGLVHLRCCYNNKYLQRWTENQWWIVAQADEPKEDQSKWSCTLFKPVYDNIADGVRFLHVQLQRYVGLSMATDSFNGCMFAGGADGPPSEDNYANFTIIDWESLVILPNRVAFKGDNGMYLRAHPKGGHNYLQYNCSDSGHPEVANQVFTTSDGSVRIKNEYFGKFWRLSPGWIWADSDDTTANNPDTLFRPVKCGENVVALQNLGNKYFCKRLSTDGKDNCLNASISSITDEAKMEVKELVLSRQIYDVDFRLMDARIYGQSVVMMATGVAVNDTSEEITQVVKLSYQDKRSTAWKANVSLKVGVTTTLETGVPFILNGKVGISAEFSGSYEWGKTIEKTTALETTHTVKVPPKSTVNVRMLATMASCDVPFSYSQRDTLSNGEHVLRDQEDGVYTGVNAFNFKFEANPN